jgi:hypothetical protein
LLIKHALEVIPTIRLLLIMRDIVLIYRINISPKGLESFRVIEPQTVAYLDLTGSGIETVAHLRENARVVIMFLRL